MPTTQGPGVTSATADGPAFHVSLPSFSSVAIGKLIDGPMPQVMSPLSAGERKPRDALGQLRQPRGDIGEISGTMVRLIRG